MCVKNAFNKCNLNKKKTDILLSNMAYMYIFYTILFNLQKLNFN